MIPQITSLIPSFLRREKKTKGEAEQVSPSSLSIDNLESARKSLELADAFNQTIHQHTYTQTIHQPIHIQHNLDAVVEEIINKKNIATIPPTTIISSSYVNSSYSSYSSQVPIQVETSLDKIVDEIVKKGIINA